MEIVENNREKSEVRVKKKTLMAVVEECQRALESLNDDDDGNNDDNDGNLVDEVENCPESSSPSTCLDPLAEELCDLIKSKVGGPEFLEKLQCAQLTIQTSVPEEGNSWDIVADNDLWESGNGEDDQEDYVVVRQEDIVDGIACFMAAYLLSLKETKDLAPKQLQDALSKTFSLKKKKGKLRKALDGTKVVYNVASWSATAIGIYQNPALLGAATTAFWTSCRIISRLF
ncbi:uncharacterized protein LOC141604811 isoform X2 [Silene latifolia]|uniref:uncharacterized protein LOC141604811 isoform X2 n=1 Tax=Silene latifolia TaxID=37657 RepID=UPI003D77F1C7